jgi:glutaredoxin 1/glutaredoxin 3
MEAKMYSTSQCGWCNRVAKMLEDYDINVEKIDVSGNKVLIKEMQKAAGEKVTSVPQVIIDEKYIGGYTEVERFLKRI